MTYFAKYQVLKDCYMSKIIFLNGCCSSTKTSIVRSIEYLAQEPLLCLGVDILIDMMPSLYVGFGAMVRDGYFSFTNEINEMGKVVAVETTLKGANFSLMPTIPEMIANQWNNLIVDEVLFGDEMLLSYIEALLAHKVYFIGVLYALSVMIEREVLCGDHTIGVSNAQAEVVPEGREYDLQFDTSAKSPFVIARQILDHIDHNLEHRSFLKMH